MNKPYVLGKAQIAAALQDNWTRSLQLKENHGFYSSNSHSRQQCHNVRFHTTGPLHQSNHPPKSIKTVKAIIDCGRTVKNTHVKEPKSKCEDREYVLGPKTIPLTLAQRFGLVVSPLSPLSETQWTKVKAASNARADSHQPCPICKEEFALHQQVLLSCTHVFHRTCLHAFEKFTGRKCCPLCRKIRYETRVIHDGARHYQNKCATRIQAAWKGYVVRRWYIKLRDTTPPKDARLRKKFYREKLHKICERMKRFYDNNVEEFLEEIDSSLKKSRQVFEDFDMMTRGLSEEVWLDIQFRAAERGAEDCPICLAPLKGQGLSSGAKSRRRNHKGCVLLSCSHVFHQACLNSFEELAMLTAGFFCPVCRASYCKRTLH